jgi:hypothetical protein
MGIPGAQHELVCTLINRHPDLIRELAVLTKVKIPRHDQIVTGPNSHQVRGGSPIATDGTIRFMRDGKVVFFAQVEMQREYNLDKLATLRAYHGSEVRNTKSGGYMFVLTPAVAEVLKFRANDKQYREEFRYRSSHLSGEDLRRLAAMNQPYENRALAFALTDFSGGVPSNAASMLAEMADHDTTIANLCFQTMLEECPDVTTMERTMDPEILAKLRQLSFWRDFEAEVHAKVAAEQAEAEAARVAAEAEAEAARVAAEAEAEAARVAAEAEARAAAAAEITRAEAQGKAQGIARSLREYFALHGDTPSEYAFGRIRSCSEPEILGSWLTRAFAGEKSTAIFPEPEP